jgi:hypothetical protein
MRIVILSVIYLIMMQSCNSVSEENQKELTCYEIDSSSMSFTYDSSYKQWEEDHFYQKNGIITHVRKKYKDSLGTILIQYDSTIQCHLCDTIMNRVGQDRSCNEWTVDYDTALSDYGLERRELCQGRFVSSLVEMNNVIDINGQSYRIIKLLTPSCSSQLKTKTEALEALEKMYQLAQPIIDTIGLKDRESIHFYFGESYELLLFSKQIKGIYYHTWVIDNKSLEAIHTGLTIFYKDIDNSLYTRDLSKPKEVLSLEEKIEDLKKSGDRIDLLMDSIKKKVRDRNLEF